MKLQDSNVEVTIDGEVEKSMSFGIGNLAIAMSVLRSKMYSNPPRTVIQEICSNARDAHREAKKPNEPIHITLPTNDQQTLTIRDFGLGISPARIKNVFVMYGNSTKRSNNNQTGGFGLGSKSPWSYTDSFSVVTYTPEDKWIDNAGVTHENVMVKRHYVAFIDPSQVGALNLMNSEVTNEKQGTEIIIPVQRVDFYKFAQELNNVCKYWNPRPNITNIQSARFSWEKFTPEFSSDNWYSVDTSNNAYGKNIVLVDDIPYVVNNGLILSNRWFEHNKSFNGVDKSIIKNIISMDDGHFIPRFKTGEIYVTANRESIDYQNEDTIKKIVMRYADIAIQLKKQLEDKISKFEDIFDLSVYIRNDLTYYVNLFANEKIRWNNIDISLTNLPLGVFAGEHVDFKDIITHIFSRGSITSRKARPKYSGLVFNKDSKVMIDDTENSSQYASRIRTFFNANPDVHNVCLVSYAAYNPPSVFLNIPTDKTEQQLRDEIIKRKSDIVSRFESGLFSHVKKLKLSSFEPYREKREYVKRGPIVKKINYYALGLNNNNVVQEQLTDISYDTLQGYYVVKGNSGLYVNSFDKDKADGNYEDSITISRITGIILEYKVNSRVFVVTPKILKKCHNLKPFKSLIEEVFNNHIKNNTSDIASKAASERISNDHNFTSFTKIFDYEELSKYLPKDHIVMQTNIDLKSRFNVDLFNFICKYMSNEIDYSKDVDALVDKVNKNFEIVKSKYPMLELIADKWYNANYYATERAADYVDYIKKVDFFEKNYIKP